MSWLFMQEIEKDLETWDEHWNDINVESINENSNLAWQWVKNTLLGLKREGDILRQRAHDYSIHVSLLEKCGAMFSEHACYIPSKLMEVMEKADKLDKLPMQLLDLMVPEGPGRDPKQIGIHNAVVGAVIHLLETSEMPNLKNMKFEPGNIRKIINEKPETWTNLVEAVQAARDNLYEALPTGDIDAFELLKVVKSHVKELDAITETKT